MGLLTTPGPPAWHPAPPQVKTTARQAVQIAKTFGTTLEKAALGFSLRPKDPNIATTLVSMPTKEILNENLQIVTEGITEKDQSLYESLIELFSTTQPQPCSWEGIEVTQYKEWAKNH